MTDYEGKEFLTVKELADYLRRDETTIRRWHREGKLRGIPMVQGGPLIFRKTAVDDAIQEREYPELGQARKELGINEPGKTKTGDSDAGN